MKMTFRWYGDNDPVTLEKISQIPNMSGVVTAIYDVPVGHVWSEQSIAKRKTDCEKHGLKMEVIESVPVHEDIKLGLPTRDKYIDAYKQTIRRLGKAGVKCICYNFMPVFDWLRTDLKHKHTNGANSLAYDHEQLSRLDPHNLHLPGWDESYKSDELAALIDKYAKIDHETLFANLVYFLSQILPVCEEEGIGMAIHPDDPPWDMFGLPRIVTGEAFFDRLFTLLPSPSNGITFCTGSLGAGRSNDLVKMAKKYALQNRIFFAHLRQIRYEKEKDFVENGHLSKDGSLDMFAIVRALCEGGFDGYVRPDHGRNIWGEDGKPGYGLYDRALGACYLNGLFEAIERIAATPMPL